MPPMPANAVLVHELEQDLEKTSLNSKVKEEKKPLETTILNQPQAPSVTTQPEPANPTLAHNVSHTYPSYQVGMYVPGATNAFVGIQTPPGPVHGGVPQHQKPQHSSFAAQQQQNGTGAAAPHHVLPQQQGGLYGTATAGPTTVMGTGSDTVGSSGAEPPTSASAIPPAMTGAMPYGNPPLFYGQQPYQISQPAVGYGYGYGQFSGGYGYQMGQGGGYGQPYDDQPQHSSHHSGNIGYSKNSHGSGGGYRRNTHHTNSHGNQYQNQYNPQQPAGYASGPYSIGYNVDHFSQHRGYGPGNGMAHYGVQAPGANYQVAPGFDDDKKNKNQRGGSVGGAGGVNNGNPNPVHFQPGLMGGQGGQQHPQQHIFLPGATDDTSPGSGAWPQNFPQGWQGS